MDEAVGDRRRALDTTATLIEATARRKWARAQPEGFL